MGNTGPDPTCTGDPQMSKENSLIETSDFLILRHSGEIDPLRALNIIWTAWQSGRLVGRKRLLMDLRTTTVTPCLESQELLRVAQSIAQVAKGIDGLHIASVIPAEQDRVQLAEFVESGARSLGANYRFFTDYDEASDWLKTTGPEREPSE